MKVYNVYILKCSDGSYYTGVTNNLERRLSEHNSGDNRSAYTFFRRPIQLVFFAEFSDVEIAIEAEKQLKKWSKAKKEALIDNKFDLLVELSKKNFKK